MPFNFLLAHLVKETILLEELNKIISYVQKMKKRNVRKVKGDVDESHWPNSR